MGLVTFEVVHGETDLQVSAVRDLTHEAVVIVAALRADLEGYIGSHPRFAESFVPVEADADAPEIVRAMAAAGLAAGVGPMAAVAGAVAERVARALSAYSAEVIVENGGDLYIVGSHRAGCSCLPVTRRCRAGWRLPLVPEVLPWRSARPRAK